MAAESNDAIRHGEGGTWELLRLAFPLILSNSFLTLQITIDRVLLSWYHPDAVAASLPAALLFWTPLVLLQYTANYATTFVAQYLGAGRPHRIGPAVWQALYFSVVSGILFLALLPLGDPVFTWVDHPPEILRLETIYYQCLCFSALPTLLTAAASSFFAGRGDSWTVLFINAVGLAANAVLDYLWIFGHGGFPEWGIAGAGWATVIGTWASAGVGIALLFRHRYRAEFHTLNGWRLDWDLMRRLLRYGLPNGAHWALEGVAFSVFVFLIGGLGGAALAATNVAVTINMVAFLPMLGIAQAVSILVGQRLGQYRPEVAARSTWVGFRMVWLYMAAVALSYVLVPDVYLDRFASAQNPEEWARVEALVPVLLRFVAVYSLFDSAVLVFSFALRGAGDTLFVTLAALGLSWMLMVVPTWLTWMYDLGLYWAWACASAYVIALALVLLARFLGGKWKMMRVIETVRLDDLLPETPSANGESVEEDRVYASPALGVSRDLSRERET